MRIVPVLFLVAALAAASPANAGTVSGVVTDATGAALTQARVVVRDIATGREIVGETDDQGRYKIETRVAGTYLVIVSRAGFSEAARTVVVDSPEQVVDLPVQLDLGMLTAEVSVTAVRAERELKQIPLHVETMSQAAIQARNPHLHRGHADDGAQRHAGRQRPVRGAAAAARPRLDAPAGAGGR